MQIRKMPATKGLLLCATSVMGVALGLTGCGGDIQFQGKTALSVVGEPPPPPAPPPKPEPPKPPPRVEVKDNKIEIREKIQFEYDKATIKEASFNLMDEIVKVIKENPQIKKIQIEGHASSDGDDAHNMRLSEARAKAVKKYLVDHGIAADMLVAKGFGETKPIASNDTEEGREKNRRVEFNILEQDITKKKIQIDPTTGQQKVLEETKIPAASSGSAAPPPPAPAPAAKTPPARKAPAAPPPAPTNPAAAPAK